MSWISPLHAFRQLMYASRFDKYTCGIQRYHFYSMFMDSCKEGLPSSWDFLNHQNPHLVAQVREDMVFPGQGMEGSQNAKLCHLCRLTQGIIQSYSTWIVTNQAKSCMETSGVLWGSNSLLIYSNGKLWKTMAQPIIYYVCERLLVTVTAQEVAEPEGRPYRYEKILCRTKAASPV